MRVLISGASGLIGGALSRRLDRRGHQVAHLVRRAPTGPSEIEWHPDRGRLDGDSVAGFDAVVHLAGAGIGDRRWSEERRGVIRSSRVDSTRLLAAALAGTARPPRVFLSGSAIGYYGSRSEIVTEDSPPPPNPDFLADVTREWEAAATAATAAGIRTVVLRTGIVLAASGGALPRLLLPFRLGLGGRLGSGDTWWSWIALEDEVAAIEHLIDHEVAGPVNLVAPNPLTNAEFTRTLGRVLRRPTVLPVPRKVLELMLGRDRAASLLFTSSRVAPARLLASGFEFAWPNLEPALRSILQ